MPRSNSGRPIEDVLLARHFGEDHHAGEKEIDIQTFINGEGGLVQRDEPRDDEEQRAGADPIRLLNAAGAQQHTKDGGERDCPDQDGGEMRDLQCVPVDPRP